MKRLFSSVDGRDGATGADGAATAGDGTTAAAETEAVATSVPANALLTAEDVATGNADEVGEEIDVTTLKLDGKPNGPWEGKWTNLPLTENSKTILYYVKEVTTGEAYGAPDAEGKYTNDPVITGDQVKGFTVTNSHTPGKTTVAVEKVWDDEDDQDGLRPESVTVKLLADGEDTGLTLTLSEKNGWKATGS